MKANILIGSLLASCLIGIGSFSLDAQAKTSSTTPTSIRGTFYRYFGNHKWAKLTITTHAASLTEPGNKPFKITSTSHSSSHHLAYQFTTKRQGRTYFTLQAKLKSPVLSPFPENGMSLTKRKIGNHVYKVIRGYQGGYGFDFIKSHRFAKDYSHTAYNY